MNFEEMIDGFGFGMAVVIMEKKLPPEFWSDLSFDQWAEIGLYASGELKNKVFEMLFSKAETTEEWLYICDQNLADGLKRKALENALVAAWKIEDWIAIYYHVTDSELESLALEKIRQMAGTGSIAI